MSASKVADRSQRITFKLGDSDDSANEKRTCLLVLGMHRSGTSAVTRILSLIGAALPKNILGANLSNETGHWEPNKLVTLHDKLLADTGSRWDDWRSFDLERMSDASRQAYVARLSEIIDDEYSDSPMFILKEPRISKFVDDFCDIVNSLGIDTHCVVMLRNPLSVAGSLHARDRLSEQYSTLLWLRYNLDAERGTRKRPRIFVSYEDLVDDWSSTLTRITTQIDVPWKKTPQEVAGEIEAFLSPKHEHHRATIGEMNANRDIVEAVGEAYECFKKLETDPNDAEAIKMLERIHADFDTALALLGNATFTEIESRKAMHRAASQRLTEQTVEVKVLQSQIGDLKERHQEVLGDLEQEYNKLFSEAALQRTEKRRLEDANESLTSELDQQRSDSNRLKGINKKLSKTVTSLRAAQKELELSATALRTDIGSLKSEARKLRRRWTGRDRKRQSEINALKDDIRKLRDVTTARSEQIKQLSLAKEELQQKAEYLHETINMLYSSTSWRITQPVRWLRMVGNQIGTATKYGLRLFSDGRLDWSTLKRNVQRLPAMVKNRTLVSPKDLASLTDMFEPNEMEKFLVSFDKDYYLKNNPDIAEAGNDPFLHFMVHGWREHRDPSPEFSVSHYLGRYPEINRAGMNPFVHYILHGKSEKRSALPYRVRLARMEYAPRVTAIVPNYNHNNFLRRRIDTILNQTYPYVDVLVLDDCSTDNSRETIQDYVGRFPDRVKAIFNKKNSGNVFRQWRKGVEHADGELIWICESDDYCEPDFLEKLVPSFRDRSVNVAFGRIQFCDSRGKFKKGLDQYREGAESGIWDQPVCRPAYQWFKNGFGVNNVIANVGGCIWRNKILPNNVWRDAGEFTVLGDWFLYCHIAGGGQISYEPSAVAYFRQHGANTSVNSFVGAQYYREHASLMTLLRRTWAVPQETVERFLSKIEFQYSHFALEEKLGPLNDYVDQKQLVAVPRDRPHILIAMLGFEWGGGEVFPINLANALNASGCLVSILAFDMSNVAKDLLQTLDPAIAVYDAEWVAAIGADEFLRSAGVSLVHSHMISLDHFFFADQQIQTSLPYLVTLHGSYDSGRLPDTDLAAIISGVTRWVYTADKNLETFKSWAIPESRFVKLKNGMPIDDKPFPKSRDELGISDDAIVFTLVARGILRKGWRASILAFKMLQNAIPDRKVHLLLCGDGEQTRIHQEANGDDTSITFLGFQSRVHGLYRISDCAIVPTRFAGESFPLCIIQALQTGTPVIGTRVGEIEAMVSPTDCEPGGILIDPVRNTDEFIRNLSKAMAEMMSSDVRKKYSRAAMDLGKNYAIDKVAKSYAKLYDELLLSE